MDWPVRTTLRAEDCGRVTATKNRVAAKAANRKTWPLALLAMIFQSVGMAVDMLFLAEANVLQVGAVAQNQLT